MGERASVNAGDVLAGKFRVERVVGRGGMGVVVEAMNVKLDQRVALKLLAAGADDPAVVERFSREARAAARLRSEHVARVYDVGKDTLHGPFIVMELLEGKTLADVIATGRVAMHRAVEYVIDACEGLAEAHARGIVHQDVKPPNLFLVTGADGRASIKVLDFGIATMRTKDLEANASSSPRSAGTPAYLAPEQLRGTPPVDHRADIWALGCVLYELLAGQRAFQAERFTELVTKILEGPPHPFPTDLEVPAALAAAVLRCLEKDPQSRFKSTGELALALLPFARRRAHSAVTRAVAHVKSGGLDPHLEVPSSMPPPPEGSGDLPSSEHLRAPSVPSFSTAPASNGAVPSSRVAARTTALPPSAKIAIAGCVALFLMGAGVAAWTRATSSHPETTTPPAAATSALAAPLASPIPTPTSAPAAETPDAAPTTEESTPASAAPTVAAPAAAPAVQRPHAPGSSHPVARPSVGSPATSHESDIRLTR